MTKYINTFPQHFLSDGSPAAFYNVFFGEPNQDPKANPKVPFSDKSLLNDISATQTLNSSGAYSSDIFLDGSYSIRIESPSGSLFRESPEIFGLGDFGDFPNNTDPTKGSALIGHILDGFAGVASFASTVQTELNRVSSRMVYVTDPRFGATGLGPGFDDSAAIQAAINYAESIGGAIVWCPSPPVSYDGATPLVFAAPGKADGDGNFQTPATSNTGVVLWEETLHSFTGALIPFERGKQQNFAPMQVGLGRTIHGDDPLFILSVGALSITGDARSSFSADISIDGTPGVNGQELLVPAGSKTNINNRNAQKGPAMQVHFNRASSGNFSGPTWRRDWNYDNEEFQYVSGAGRRFTGDYQMWSLVQGGDNTTARDHLVFVQGEGPTRNGVLQFQSVGDPGTDPAEPVLTQINDSNFLKTRAKGDWLFDMTGEMGVSDIDGVGINRAQSVIVRCIWDNAAIDFTGLGVQYDNSGTFGPLSRAFFVQDFSGFEQFVCAADGNVRIGKTTGKVGLYNANGVALQTGVAVTIGAVHAALVALNVFTA